LTANIVRALGVNMGTKFKEPNRKNPLGYFEDVDFLTINQELLRKAGGTWLDPPPAENIMKVSRLFKDEIEKLFTKKSSQNVVWGWKEPSSILSWGAYRPFVNNAKIIACFRGKKDVVRSLMKFTGKPREVISSVFDCYFQRLHEIVLRSQDRCLVVKYECMMKNPVNNIQQIHEFISPNFRELAREVVL
jgi:hypothetical protein